MVYYLSINSIILNVLILNPRFELHFRPKFANLRESIVLLMDKYNEQLFFMSRNSKGAWSVILKELQICKAAKINL